MEANPALLLGGAISPTLIREDFITKHAHFSGCEVRVDRRGVGGKQLFHHQLANLFVHQDHSCQPNPEGMTA
jgi:hypothetical protein